MPDKAEILAAIATAQELKLIEQRRYRDAINAALAKPATNSDLERIEAIGVDNLFDCMEGQEWPPASSDWQEHHGIPWEQVPSYKRLQKVQDEDVRFALQFFAEINDHTTRLQAAARFYGLCGCSGPDTDFILAAWRQLALRRAMLNAMQHDPASQLPTTSTLPIKSTASACTSTASMA